MAGHEKVLMRTTETITLTTKTIMKMTTTVKQKKNNKEGKTITKTTGRRQ